MIEAVGHELDEHRVRVGIFVEPPLAHRDHVNAAANEKRGIRVLDYSQAKVDVAGVEHLAHVRKERAPRVAP